MRKHVFWYYFTAIQVFIVIFLLMPFFQHNSLHINDMSGHYFSAWFTHEHLFKEGKLTGWNPYHLGGFSQNLSYPPLFAWLVAVLAYLTGLPLAFKLVVALSVLLAPLSFYIFGRALGFDESKAGLLMLGMFGMQFLIFEPVGLNMVSTFNTGLVTSALALPLLFFYAASLLFMFRKKEILRPILLPSVLFALIILSHVFYALLIALLSVSIAIFYRSEWRKYLAHAVLTALFSMFWLVPLLQILPFMKVIYSPFAISPVVWYYAPAIAIAFIALAKGFVSENKNIRALAFFMVLLTAFIAIGSLLELGFHFYRLTMMYVLFAPVFLVVLIKKKLSAFLLALSLILLVISLYPRVDVRGSEEAVIPLFSRAGGRMLAVSYLNNNNLHTLDYAITRATGNEMAGGLFIDSHKNSWYLAAVEKIVDPSSYVMSEHMLPGSDYGTHQQYLPYYYTLFAITHVLSPNKVDGTLIKQGLFSFEGRNYSVYEVSDAQLVEPLTYVPEVVHAAWDEEVEKWFFSEDVGRVFVNRACCEQAAAGDEHLDMIEKSNERIVFTVDAEHDVPILIKVNYDPNWRAYSSDGEIPLYLASPYMMLVYGNREITLSYL